MNVEVLQVKGSCQLQDHGRPGQSALGIPRGGFADAMSAHLANQLVGQSAYSPLIECVLGGPTLHFSESCSIALTGADVQPKVDGKEVAMWQRIKIKAGSTLSCKHSRNGLRSYIAFSRKCIVETWRQSVSPIVLGEKVFPASSMLQKRQILKFASDDYFWPTRVAKIYAEVSLHIAKLSSESAIRIKLHLAPESFLITENKKLLTELTDSAWKVSPESSRMGIRLIGPSLSLGKTFGMMRSGPVLPGTVQLLPDGGLIVTHVDSQTIGGYPRIGLVDADALCVLAQAEPKKTHVQLHF